MTQAGLSGPPGAPRRTARWGLSLGGRCGGSLFGFCRLAGLRGALRSFGEGGFVEGADVLGLVGVAFLRGESGEGFVLLGTDVGACQLGSDLSLVGHNDEKQGERVVGD